MGKFNLNDVNDEFIKKYFDDIKDNKSLDHSEEKELFDKIKNGDKNAIEELIQSNLKFVVSIAKEYKSYGLPLNDLINEGNYGLIKAVEKFDPDKGYKFISYAVWWIRQSILQALNENSRTIRYPNSLISKVNKAKKENVDSEEYNEENEFINELPKCSYMDDDLSSDNSNEVSIDSFYYEEMDEETEDDKQKFSEELNKTLAILDEREKGIIECYFGMNGNDDDLTLEDIGEKYNLTKERVRQIKELSIRKLRSNIDNLHEYLNK